MSFLEQYKQLLDVNLEQARKEQEQVDEKHDPHLMHRLLTDVLQERSDKALKTQELINDTFGWDAASTVEECADVWNAAPLAEMSQAAADRVGERDWTANIKSQRAEAQPNQAARLGQRKTFGSEPKVGDMVIMQGGIGRIVDQDGSNGNVMIKGQKGDERVFPRNQITGPKQVNGKTAWALKTALPTRG